MIPASCTGVEGGDTQGHCSVSEGTRYTQGIDATTSWTHIPACVHPQQGAVARRLHAPAPTLSQHTPPLSKQVHGSSWGPWG